MTSEDTPTIYQASAAIYIKIIRAITPEVKKYIESHPEDVDIKTKFDKAQEIDLAAYLYILKYVTYDGLMGVFIKEYKQKNIISDETIKYVENLVKILLELNK